MSRTYRKSPVGLEHLPAFTRDNFLGVLKDPNGSYGEIWGMYRKRKAKKIMASKHHIANKTALKEEIER